MADDGMPDTGDTVAPEPSPGPRTPIRAAEGLLAIKPVLVGADDPLDSVIQRAASAPSTRVLGVVDGDGILVGVVIPHDLVAAVVGRLTPGALLTQIHDVDGVGEYGRYVEAKVARDLMRPPAALTDAATLAEAFHLMYLRELSGAYVIDDAGRPIGYIDALELAAAIVAAD
jgi:CBS domain-containing protein